MGRLPVSINPIAESHRMYTTITTTVFTRATAMIRMIPMTLMFVLVPFAPVAVAQQADREQIIDIERLNAVITDATRSLAEPLRETQLSERFAEVNELLQSEQVDKRALMASLQSLSAELSDFVDRLDSGPLFDAEEQVGPSNHFLVRLLINLICHSRLP